MKKILFACLIFVFIFPALAFSSPVLLDNMPAYNQGQNPWCAYVSEASILGYWDMHGYPNLFEASPPEIFQTANVWPEIIEMVGLSSGPAYKLSLNFEYFAESRGYAFSTYTGYSHYTFVPDFDVIINEIDHGRPFYLGSTDIYPTRPGHGTPVFGYDVRPDGNYIAYYMNWYEEETVLWREFNPMGLWSMILVEPVTAPQGAAIPEPATMLLFGAGLVGLAGFGRKKFKK